MTKSLRDSLSGSKLARYKRALESKAEEVRAVLTAEHAKETVRRQEEPLDSGDWSNQSLEEWLFLNQNDLNITLFREVQQALRRLEDGTYGVCQECGEPISIKRLEAVPWARFCVPCRERLALMPDQT